MLSQNTVNSFFSYFIPESGRNGSLPAQSGFESVPAVQTTSNKSSAHSQVQIKSSHSNAAQPVVGFSQPSDPQPKGLLNNYTNFYGGAEPHAPKTAQMVEKYKK